MLSYTYQRIRLRSRSIHNLVDSRGVTDHSEVVVVQTDKLVDVSDAVADLPDGWVLEPSLWVLTSVVEDARLLVDIVEVQRLKLTSLAELNVLQTFNVDDDSVRLCLGNSLLNLQVRELQLIGETNTAIYHRLRHHLKEVGSASRVRQIGSRDVVNVLRDVVLLPVAKQVISP